MVYAQHDTCPLTLQSLDKINLRHLCSGNAILCNWDLVPQICCPTNQIYVVAGALTHQQAGTKTPNKAGGTNRRENDDPGCCNP